MSTGIGFKKALVTVPGPAFGYRPFVHSKCGGLYIDVPSTCTFLNPTSRLRMRFFLVDQ